ncbi:hypothetical protein [Methylobacter svalbardensis]|uniref:hypothetical protein n=1 Tax=Methylobacter svalbardensis TaxID=3080016 RepID=UPI0030EC809C
MKIAIVYPRISHYREDFFNALAKNFDIDIYVYENDVDNIKEHFDISSISVKKLKSIKIFSKIKLFNFFSVLRGNYDLVILSGEIRVITIPLLLILLRLFRVKTILWGHGISIHSYLQEEKNLHPFRIWFHKLANHIWLYTEAEKTIYKKYFPENKITALNNTINVADILNRPQSDKEYLLAKYGIKTPINFIFCARFTILERRADLLLELIKKLDPSKFGFIIIGEGQYRPDFTGMPNVLCLGKVYDTHIKNELFDLADLYLQPAWIGLSANEALAYGKAILTFKRSPEIKQCVEYAYLNEKNSYIAEDVNDMVEFINSLNKDKIKTYSENSLTYAKENLLMEKMVLNAVDSINSLS